MDTSRRKTIKQLGTGLAAAGLFGFSATTFSCAGEGAQAAKKAAEAVAVAKEPFFKISLAQWSLHRSFFVDAIEFVNTFYFNKAKNRDYLKDLKGRCDGEGVKPLLIMCDALGDLGDLDSAKQKAAIENHYQWVEAAKFLGCHSIRVNAAGNGTAEEVKAAAIEGLGSLTEFGKANGINIIVENHGSHSSNGAWLAAVMKGVYLILEISASKEMQQITRSAKNPMIDIKGRQN